MKKLIALLLLSVQAFAGLPPTTSKDSADSSDLTTFTYRFPNFTGSHTGTIFSLGVNSIAGGGTGQTSASAAFNALSPMTTLGNLIYGGTSGTGTALPGNTTSTANLLCQTGTGTVSAAPSWCTADGVLSFATNAANGGLSISGDVVSMTQASGSTPGWISPSDYTVFSTAVNQFIQMKNTSGGAMSIGQAVYITGTTAGVPNISLAKANAVATMPPAGLMTATCANNATCNVQVAGLLNNFDTSALTVGQAIYVSDTTAGALTTTQNSPPNIPESIGFVKVSNASTGSVYINYSQPDGIQGGSRSNTWQTGDGTSGAKLIGVNNGSVQSFSLNPSTARTVTIPDATFTVAGLSINQSFTAGQAVTPVAVTPGASYTPDCSVTNHWRILMTSATNFTLNAPTNCKDGQRLVFEFKQPPSGSVDTVTLNAVFNFGVSPPSYTMTATLGKSDQIGCIYNTGTTKCPIIVGPQGF